MRSCADCSEYVESIVSGADDDTGQLRVPVKFLDLLLSLVHKQQLRRHAVAPITRRRRRHVVGFDGKVPDRESIVGGGDGEHRAVVGIPFQRRDRRRVVAERYNRTEL